MEEVFEELPLIESDETLFEEQVNIFKECLLTDLNVCGNYENYKLNH